MSKTSHPLTSISMGLDAIFSVNQAESEVILPENKPAVESSQSTQKIPTNLLHPSPFQARRSFSDEAITELSYSIQQHGILQPLLVRKKNDHYELLAGERRLRAAKQLHLLDVPVIVCDVDDATAMAFGLIENIQRQDLNAIEEAEAYERLLNEFQLSHDLLAEKIGKSRSHITNLLRLNQLPENIKQHLSRNEITMGHARAILSLPEFQQQKMVTRIIQEELSVRQTEQIVKALSESPEKKSKPVFELSDDLKNHIFLWKNQLQEKYNADVKINFDEQGRGRLSLSVDSADALMNLVDKLCI